MLDRPPKSPLASAKPSCNSPRRVRKRSNNCDCCSEKQLDRASGKAFALPGYGGLRRSGRTSVQDSLQLKNRLFFFRAEKLAPYQQIDHRSLNFLSTHRSIRLQFAHLHGSANGYASMGTDLLFAFMSTTEHRITRAIWNAITLELRASFLARKSSLSFFLMVVWFHMACTKL